VATKNQRNLILALFLSPYKKVTFRGVSTNKVIIVLSLYMLYFGYNETHCDIMAGFGIFWGLYGSNKGCGA
jgi:hypothetical protein